MPWCSSPSASIPAPSPAEEPQQVDAGALQDSRPDPRRDVRLRPCLDDNRLDAVLCQRPERHLLGCRGVAVLRDPRRSCCSQARPGCDELGTGVQPVAGERRGPRAARRAGACASSTFTDAGGVQRQAAAGLAHDRHRGVARHACRGTGRGRRRGRRGARWPGWRRRGRAGTARRPRAGPVCTGASRPRSHTRRPMT